MTPGTRTRWLAGVGVAAVLFGPGLYQTARLSWKQRQLARQLERLQAEQHALLVKRQRLTEDSVYLEDAVRSTFKVAKPGELVVPLDEATSSTSSR